MKNLLKKQDPNKDYNVFWELLLSSLTPSFRGFHDGRYRTENESVYLEALLVEGMHMHQCLWLQATMNVILR